MKSKYLILIILLLVISTGFIFYHKKEATVTSPSHASELLDENQAPVDLTQYKGKVVLINNWASWCPPCIAEMPSIQNLKNNLKNENVVFIMVSYDDNPEKALRFVQKKNFDFEVFFPGEKYPFHTASIPATFILDKNGIVVASHSGMVDFNNPEMLKKIKDLL
jgi:thiol-disulfide isomerase/thioredoxin